MGSDMPHSYIKFFIDEPKLTTDRTYGTVWNNGKANNKRDKNMTDNITGKTILLLCPDFHNFQYYMRSALLKLGAKQVVLKSLDGIKSDFRDGINVSKVYHFLRHPHERADNTRKLISEIEGYKFDILLCVAYLYFSEFLLDYLKKKNPDVKLFLFLWDSLDKFTPYYYEYFPLFDYVYSFDRDDAKKNGFFYYPNFYINFDGHPDNTQLKYDVSIVTKISGDTLEKAEICYYVDSFCKGHGMKSFLYLQYKKPAGSFIRRKWLQHRDKNILETVTKYQQYGFIHEDIIPYEQVDKMYQESRALLDINHKDRQGMTINAITALGKGKKLITTNKRIKEESFYDPDTIYILDDENPKLDIDFFLTPP